MYKKALHTKSIWKSNLMTDIRLAKEAGFDAIEVAGTKVWDYVESGRPLEDVVERLKKYDMKIISINDICHVERTDDEAVRATLAETEKLSAIAQKLGCDCIQLVPLLALEGRSEDEVIQLTGQNIARICDIGVKYGVRFQLEPVGWSPINSLRLTKKLIDAVNRDNFGTVIDFFHLFVGGQTTPDDVRHFDPKRIYHIHFCDCRMPKKDEIFDETVLRGMYAGEGEVPIEEWVQAVKDTGYDGWWSYELISAYHWTEDVQEVAQKCSEILDKYLA